MKWRWLYVERGQALARLCPHKLALNVGSYKSIDLDLSTKYQD